MKIEFVGPASVAIDGGVNYPALLDGQKLSCHFSYEALDDVESDGILGDALKHFKNHQKAPIDCRAKDIRWSCA